MTTTRPCSCGSPTTHRLRFEILSNVGVATKYERGCGRCIDLLAFRLLSSGDHRTAVAEALSDLS